MASVLHGSARTTPCVRAELQASKESSRALAARYGLNVKTVDKWRKRSTTADAPMGPKAPKSTVLTPAEEAVVVVAFRQKTMLPLDDVLGCLKDTIPNLSRSALHRCVQRHGISRLRIEETAQKRKRFKTYEIGYVHIDSCELRHADGKLIMFLAIDRVSKFTYVEFHSKAGKMAGSAFLRSVVEVFPYRIHTVLTDNGMAFADLPKYRDSQDRGFPGGHIFGRVCDEHGIERRLTKPYHPWTKDPSIFKINPHHLIPGPHTYIPLSMLRSAFMLIDDFGLTSQKALSTVAAGPTRYLGLDDRGEIIPGQRADLVRVSRRTAGWPVPSEVWRQGRRVA
jgi:transposase-like protein